MVFHFSTVIHFDPMIWPGIARQATGTRKSARQPGYSSRSGTASLGSPLRHRTCGRIPLYNPQLFMICSYRFLPSRNTFMATLKTGAEPLPLDHATFNTMISSTVEALPHHPHATAEQRAQRREAAYLAIAALLPRDPLEAMLAARIVALHFHAMHKLAGSIQPNISPAGGPTRLRRPRAGTPAPATTPAGTASHRGRPKGSTAQSRGRTKTRTRAAPGHRRPRGTAPHLTRPRAHPSAAEW
jgi:hypothetical protein